MFYFSIVPVAFVAMLHLQILELLAQQDYSKSHGKDHLLDGLMEDHQVQ